MQNKFSEQDIQDYAAGRFTGDHRAFEELLNADQQIQARVKAYQELFRILATDAPPSLSFNLADRVIQQVQQQSHAAEPKPFQSVNYMLILLLGAAVVIGLRQFDFKLLTFTSDFNLFFVSALAIVLFISGFHIVELKQREKRWEETEK